MPFWVHLISLKPSQRFKTSSSCRRSWRRWRIGHCQSTIGSSTWRQTATKDSVSSSMNFNQRPMFRGYRARVLTIAMIEQFALPWDGITVIYSLQLGRCQEQLRPQLFFFWVMMSRMFCKRRETAFWLIRVRYIRLWFDYRLYANNPVRQYVSQLENSDELLEMLSSTYDQDEKRQNVAKTFYPSVRYDIVPYTDETYVI